MNYDDPDSNDVELAALQWFERMQPEAVDEATLETHRRWLKAPANAEAYSKVERVFSLLRTLADSPEIARLSEETNKRIEGDPRCIPESGSNPNRAVKAPPEK